MGPSMYSSQGGSGLVTPRPCHMPTSHAKAFCHDIHPLISQVLCKLHTVEFVCKLLESSTHCLFHEADIDTKSRQAFEEVLVCYQCGRLHWAAGLNQFAEVTKTLGMPSNSSAFTSALLPLGMACQPLGIEPK